MKSSIDNNKKSKNKLQESKTKILRVWLNPVPVFIEPWN